MLKCVVLLLVAVAVSVSAKHRQRRQYSGYSDVGYSNGGRQGHQGGTAPALKACVAIHELANGQAVCAYSGCRLRCHRGYHFIATEGPRRVMLSCDHSSGNLTFRGQQWAPQMTLCAPECRSTCHNGGSCTAPGKCTCQWPYTGDTCEDQVMVGDDPNVGRPRLQPQRLASNQERVDCEPGTRMPDGSTSVILSYRNKTWFYPDGRILLGVDQVTCEKVSESNKPGHVIPSRPPVQRPPQRPVQPLVQPPVEPSPPVISNKPHEERMQQDAPPAPLVQSYTPPQHHCAPSCQNRGLCVAPNVCSCPRGYWGPVCQAKLCTYPRFQSDLHASLGGTLRRMKFECHPGYYTRDNRDRVVILCHRGIWVLASGRLLTEQDVQCYPGRR